MDARRRRLRTYKKARRRFAVISYLLFFVWLLLAFVQWLIISTIYDARQLFIKHHVISVIFFAIAMLLVTIFIFFEKVRFLKGLNWVLTLLIVEFVIIGLFALVARSWWPDMVFFFVLCALLVCLFILLGSIIPHDLTLDVVILFVLAFIFLIITIFWLMLYVIVKVKYSFLVYQIFISIIVLLFVMYHAQTINGGRFAEMRTKDFLLASLILFHDFIIIYMLTFYAQTVYKIATPDSMYQTTTQDDLDIDYNTEESGSTGGASLAVSTNVGETTTAGNPPGETTPEETTTEKEEGGTTGESEPGQETESPPELSQPEEDTTGQGVAEESTTEQGDAGESTTGEGTIGESTTGEGAPEQVPGTTEGA